MELVSRAHLSFKRRVARDLLPHGVNPKQVYVLRQLAERGGLSPSEVAEMIFADRPTATSMLNTLQRAGFIHRRPHPGDGRQVLVEISAQGRRKLASVPLRLWRTGHVAFDPEARLDPQERRELARLLVKLNDAIEGGAPPAERRMR